MVILMFNYWSNNLFRHINRCCLTHLLHETRRKATQTKSIVVCFLDVRSKRKSGKIIFGPTFLLSDIKRVICINCVLVVIKRIFPHDIFVELIKGVYDQLLAIIVVRNLNLKKTIKLVKWLTSTKKGLSRSVLSKISFKLICLSFSSSSSMLMNTLILILVS